MTRNPMQDPLSAVEKKPIRRLSPGTILTVFVLGVLVGVLIQMVWLHWDAGGPAFPASARPVTEPKGRGVEPALSVSLPLASSPDDISMMENRDEEPCHRGNLRPHGQTVLDEFASRFVTAGAVEKGGIQ